MFSVKWSVSHAVKQAVAGFVNVLHCQSSAQGSIPGRNRVKDLFLFFVFDVVVAVVVVVVVVVAAAAAAAAVVVVFLLLLLLVLVLVFSSSSVPSLQLCRHVRAFLGFVCTALT